MSCEFSVGWAIKEKERTAIGAIPTRVWADAIDADGGHRDGAGLAEITGVLPVGLQNSVALRELRFRLRLHTR